MAQSKALLPLAGLTWLATSASADPSSASAQLAYVTNYTQQLMMIDMQTPGTILIGNIGFAAQGLAATNSGRLYATNNAGNLFDITGAVVTPVAPLGALDVGALDSSGSTLW